MHGDVLFPLNAMKEAYPDVYANEVSKYRGRERLLEKKIPALNCLWNDVLHLSPINPQIILDTWRAEGLYEYANCVGKEFHVFKVPSGLIEDANTVCFQSYCFDISTFDPSQNKFWSFDRGAYREQLRVHPDQIRVWHADRAADRRLLWFSHTMHVLTKQSIDTRKCEWMTCG